MIKDEVKPLITELCGLLDFHDAAGVIARGAVEVDGFEVNFDQFDSDPDALYLNFDYGIVTAGRSLRVFRLLLEANLAVYAADQAQMGMNADTGGVLLIVRIAISPDVDGPWLHDTVMHYIEHGRYWRDSIITSHDDMFEGVCAGNYVWLRA